LQRRADIQANQQTMKLAHDDVFQTTSHKLFFRPKNFRTNKSGDIIERTLCDQSS